MSTSLTNMVIVICTSVGSVFALWKMLKSELDAIKNDFDETFKEFRKHDKEISMIKYRVDNLEKLVSDGLLTREQLEKVIIELIKTEKGD